MLWPSVAQPSSVPLKQRQQQQQQQQCRCRRSLLADWSIPRSAHRSHLAHVGLIASSVLLTKRVFSRRRASSDRCVVALHALSGESAPQFQLQSACGRVSQPFEVAPIDSSGSRPPGAFLDLVSVTGLKPTKGVGFMNQDCVAVRLDVGGRSLGIVADGHGENGHHCAARLCETLPGLLSQVLDSADVSGAIKVAFAEAERDLEEFALEQRFSIQRSGAAVVVAAMLPDQGVAYLVSCGDSQAIISDMASGTFQSSRVHHAHDTAEHKRIMEAGGLIKVSRPRCRNSILSRVCGRDRSYQLAMSRSLGDLCLKPLGVTDQPSVRKVPLPSRACAVLGSDGLFEFMPPAEVDALIHQQVTRGLGGMSAQELVDIAQRRWDKEEGGLYCDDVSCLILCSSGAASQAGTPATYSPKLVLNCLNPDSCEAPEGAY